MSIFINTFCISSVNKKTVADYRRTRSRTDHGAAAEFPIHRDAALGSVLYHHASDPAANSRSVRRAK
jgi:hypothetical protein